MRLLGACMVVAAELRWCQQLAGMHAAAGMHERCCGMRCAGPCRGLLGAFAVAGQHSERVPVAVLVCQQRAGQTSHRRT